MFSQRGRGGGKRSNIFAFYGQTLTVIIERSVCRVIRERPIVIVAHYFMLFLPDWSQY